jgi:hypothetical protein
MRKIFALACLTGFFCGAFASPENDLHLAQFLAGAQLIKSASWLSKAEIAHYYVSLARITGISAPEACSRIDRFRSDPEGWNRIQQKMREILEGVPPSFKSKESPHGT